MRVKAFGHLALAGLLAFGTAASAAENRNSENQNRGGKPSHVHSSGSTRVNAGSVTQFRAQSYGNTVRIQNHNGTTARQHDFNRNAYINRKSNAAVVKQQNPQLQSVQQFQQNKVRVQSYAQGSGKSFAQISQTQRVRIREAYRHHRHRFHRLAWVSFPIFVGAYVSPDYTYYDVPEYFAEYIPGYEGYKYIIVGDELLIIDPETWEIVAIIPV